MTTLRQPAETAPTTRSRIFPVLLAVATVLMVLVSMYAAKKQMTPNLSVFGIDYGFGPVIQALVQQHRFGSANPDYGFWCYAGRMPVIPYLGAASSRLSSTASVFLLIKNLIFWPLWIYAFLRLKRHYRVPDKWALLTILLLLFAPYNLSIAGRVNVEEGFLFAMVALLFSFLLTLDGLLSALIVGLLIAAIYLTKSSMLLLCFAAAVWVVVKYWKTNPKLIAFPLLGLVLAVVGWGAYIHSVTGVFAVGAKASSWNGWNFYKGNNEWTYNLYPRVNLDSLDSNEAAHRLLPFVPVHNEWELNQAQLELGEQYVKANPSAILHMDLRKLLIACCDLGEAPASTAGHTRSGVVLSDAINHLTLLSVFIFALVNTMRRRVSDAEILAVLLTIGFVLPYFGGFLYSRHMVPIYGLMAITLALQLTRWKGQESR